MLRSVRISALVVSALAALSAPAPRVARADVASRFADLRAELEHRRDVDLAGTLDRAGKLRLRAVKRALAVLDKGGTGLKAEVRTARTIVNLLAKPYATELAPPSSRFRSHEALLGTPIGDILLQLQTEVEAVLATVAAALGEVTPQTAARLQALLTRAQTRLAAIDPAAFQGWARNLFVAYQAVARGEITLERILAADGTVVVRVDEVDVRQATRIDTYYFSTGFDIVARRGCATPTQFEDDPEQFVFNVGVKTTTLARVGTHELYSGALVLGEGQDGIFRANPGGVLVITSIRRLGRKTILTGTFAFTGENPSAATHEVEGAFKVVYDPSARTMCTPPPAKRD